MTVTIVAQRPVMPGYETADLDEVHNLSSYHHASLVTNPTGLFPYAQTEPTTDMLNASSWGTSGEGPQNFQDFSDNGSSHSGEGEEYIFTSGQTTPKGMKREHAHAPEASWNTSRTGPSITASHAMSRMNSNRSTVSSLSQTSRMSNLHIGGTSAAFRNGSHIVASSMAGMDLLLESNVNTVPSQMFWPGYGIDMGVNADGTFPLPDVNTLHVTPAQMQLGGDAANMDGSSTGSWEGFSSSISRTSSPISADETWLSAPLSPHSSPELQGDSPRLDRNMTIAADYLDIDQIARPETAVNLSQPFLPRRPTGEGESARDHVLYKNAVPQADGLYHCPYEGQAGCNHKPEKLKCNYDKFVDSHLKPYRCKANACEGAQFSSTACLLRHEREAHGLHGHGEKPFLCRHEGCERSFPGNGFPRQWNLRDHMKRVHNDQGSTSAATAAPAQAVGGKGRKRKTDVPEVPSTSSRKASLKSMPPAEDNKPSEQPLLEQWMNHHKVVQDMVRSFDKPNGTKTLHQISEVQKHLHAMAKMTPNFSGPAKSGSGRDNYGSTG